MKTREPNATPTRCRSVVLRATIVLAAAALTLAARAAEARTSFKFDFGGGAVAPGYTAVRADVAFDKDRGYGFEPGAAVQEIDRGGDPLRGDFVTSDALFKFSIEVPEGNYRVTVTLGDAQGESTTTVKAETRRLELERIHTAPGQFETRSFLVNVRTPALSPGNVLKLDSRETTPGLGTSVTTTWDDKLTLQFSDARPCLCGLEIERVDDAITVFLIGDSTVTDQASEPYGTWGQMLGRWFKPPVVIANHAESGETLKAFRMQGRWFKVMSEMKPGDYVFMQFGHNDLNQRGHDGIWPRDDTLGDWVNTYAEANTDYKWLLASYAVEVKRRGGIPVIVSPMTKINIRTGELNVAGLGEYPKAAIEAAKLADVACIDLNAMSIDLATALGPQLAPKAYVEGLHSNSYGGYLFSRCIVEGIRQAKLGLANYLVDDSGTFDPKHPLPRPDDFKVPLEPRPPRPPGRGPVLGRNGSAAPVTNPGDAGRK
jgi:lysophospholipase L1-like esterase